MRVIVNLVQTSKKLKRAYNKAFKTNLTAMYTTYGGVDCFVTYLSFLRDSLIIAFGDKTKDDQELDFSIMELITAIAEYQAYQRGLENNTSKEATDEQHLHWSSFWFLVNKNMERWLKLYDTIQQSSST